MIVQDDGTSKQDTLNSDHDAPGEFIVTAPPATLIAPVVIHTFEPLETLDDDLKTQDNLTTNGQNQDKSQQQQHMDGHEDVDNEQPYGWVVVAAAFFVQAMVIGTVNGYGVYQVPIATEFEACLG
jgi:hypothetical protein